MFFITTCGVRLLLPTSLCNGCNDFALEFIAML